LIGDLPTIRGKEFLENSTAPKEFGRKSLILNFWKNSFAKKYLLTE